MSTAKGPVPTAAWMQVLSRNRQAVSYALFGLAVVLLGLAVFLGYKYGREFGPEVALSGVLGLAFAVLGLWFLQPDTPGLAERDLTYLVVLLAGGLLGLGLVLLSADFGYRWWDVLSGGPEKWRGDLSKLAAVVVGQLAGLALLFVSLSVARAEDQDNPLLRRLLYGYAAALTGLLLFEILLIVNVLAYLKMPQPSDWTTQGIYTLSEQSQKILRGLDKPARVVAVFATRRDIPYQDVTNLLNNASGVGGKFSYEEVMRHQQPVRMGELREKYFVDEEGLLVLYGDDKDAAFQFLKQEELYDMAEAARGKRPPFRGEDALMSAISYLSEGKSKAVVYFTQGNGELDVSGGLGDVRPDQRAGALVRQLEKGNYEIKGLVLGQVGREGNPKVVVADKVPEDAAVVVVAGPQRPLPGETVETLRKYLTTEHGTKRKGTLIVLAGVVENDGRMASTGLEGLLGEYNVELGNGRVLSFAMYQSNASPATVYTYASPQLAGRNSIASFLAGDNPLQPQALPVRNVRGVQSRRGGPPGGGAQAQNLLLVPSNLLVWSEENLREDPRAMLDKIRGNREELKKLSAKLSQEPLSIGVAVTEGKGGGFDPANPHAGLDRSEGTPRLVVVGNAAFVSDAALERKGQASEMAVGLFASSLAWLREKPNSLNIAARTRKDYEMAADTDVDRMVFLPGALMAFGVVGLGLGVWVVRRR